MQCAQLLSKHAMRWANGYVFDVDKGGALQIGIISGGGTFRASPRKTQVIHFTSQIRDDYKSDLDII